MINNANTDGRKEHFVIYLAHEYHNHNLIARPILVRQSNPTHCFFNVYCWRRIQNNTIASIQNNTIVHVRM